MSRYEDEFQKLNEYQKKAVTSDDRYMLINAVVGSGKTTVLVHKVLYLNIVKKVPLDRIIVLTFTNRATGEMKERLMSFSDELNGELKYLGTFHSVARTILNESSMLTELGYQSDFDIFDNDRASQILTEIIEDKKLKIKYKAKLMKRIEEFKNGKPLYGLMKSNDDIDKLIENYKLKKLECNAMDFDDIIANLVRLCQITGKAPITSQWIIIDEFQDTDITQLNMIRGLSSSDTGLFCVGDRNQIIYSFRNGTTNIFDELRRIYNPVEIGLPFNYRSTKTIIDASNALLYGGSVIGTRDYGNKIIIRNHYDEFNEAHFIASEIIKLHEEGISYTNIGILYRRQAQLEVIISVFSNNKIPVNVLFKKNLSFEDMEDILSDEGVNLMTLHASKGLEFSHVFIIGANMGNIPISSRKNDEPEELRLFYVGMTRAKNYLEISYLTKPSLPGMLGYKSSYLDMLPPELVSMPEEGTKHTLNELIGMIRDERSKKEQESMPMAVHKKYGTGKIIFEDDEIYRVDFDEYGIKEFSKIFCPLTIM